MGDNLPGLHAAALRCGLQSDAGACCAVPAHLGRPMTPPSLHALLRTNQPSNQTTLTLPISSLSTPQPLCGGAAQPPCAPVLLGACAVGAARADPAPAAAQARGAHGVGMRGWRKACKLL